MSYLDDRASLTGRVALVIGGGGGLGRASALDLGRAGSRLAICDRDPAALDETASALRAEEVPVLSGEFDARDADALAAFYDQVDDRYGGQLDVLVNVVGGTFQQSFDQSSPKGWDTLMRTNFTWLLTATQLAIPRMRVAGRGSIITITSIEGHRAAPGFAVYAAMKAAATNFSRSLAVELAPEGIRVNTIAPDYVPTPSLGYLMVGTPDTQGLHRRLTTPMGRAGTPEDIGGCVLFLASDLSSFVTGTTLHPDGGSLASSGWWNWPDVGFMTHPPLHVLEYLQQADAGPDQQASPDQD